MDEIGAAVISNTHIREVGKLIYPENFDNSRRFGKMQICDLFTFLDSLILNDKFYTLPATIEPSKSELWDKLLSKNIIETLDTGIFSEDIGKNILSRLCDIDEFTKVAGSGSDIGKKVLDKEYIFSELMDFYSTQVEVVDEFFVSKKLKFTDPYNFEIRGGTSSILYSDTFESMAKELIGWLDYSSSGTYEVCTSFLRDMYYIYAAEALGVPYYPQASRAEFAKKFPNYYDKYFKTKLYSQIAKALNETITDVYDDFEEKITFIPPFASIILDRSNKRSDILTVALDLRDEFAKTRVIFNNLERELVQLF